MSGLLRLIGALAGVAVMGGLALSEQGRIEAAGDGGYSSASVSQDGARVVYVVFHALDNGGFCDAAAFGAVSLHPVLTDAPNDTMINGGTGRPNPRATLDVYIDSGEGVILETNAGPVSGARSVTGLKTFSTYRNAQSATPIKSFPPLVAGVADECQAWVKIVSASDGPANVLMIFHDDHGDIGFDRIVNGPRTTTVSLAPRWSLVSWAGPDGVSVADALGAKGAAAGGSDVTGQVSAVYAWDSATGTWLAYFPGAANVPGANTLSKLETGRPYWIAIAGASPVTWTVRAP